LQKHVEVVFFDEVMSFDHHGSSPPPAYSEAAPGGMENEIYIDGTLYVDGVAVSSAEQQRRSARRHQRQNNPCEKVFQFLRSKKFSYGYEKRS